MLPEIAGVVLTAMLLSLKLTSLLLLDIKSFQNDQARSVHPSACISNIFGTNEVLYVDPC